MVDDQTTRIRNGQQKLNETKHSHRKTYDDERSTGDRLLAQSMSGAATTQTNAELIKVRAHMERAKARNVDFERLINSQIETASENKRTIQ